MSTAAGPDIVENGLVLYLDAGNSRSYPGTGTTWTDLSGAGNHGILTNGPTYSSLGGGSIQFDGVDDVVIGNMSSFPSVTDFTSVTWFRINVRNKEQQFFNLKGGMQFYVATNNVLNTSSYGSLPGTTSIQANTWYMASLTRNSSTSVAISYLNGNVEATGTLPSYGTVTQYYGGNYVGGGAYNLNGYLSIGMFYNRVLTQTEIKQNFNATRGRFGI